jgi:hypothetical protein
MKKYVFLILSIITLSVYARYVHTYQSPPNAELGGQRIHYGVQSDKAGVHAVTNNGLIQNRTKQPFEGGDSSKDSHIYVRRDSEKEELRAALKANEVIDKINTINSGNIKSARVEETRSFDDEKLRYASLSTKDSPYSGRGEEGGYTFLDKIGRFDCGEDCDVVAGPAGKTDILGGGLGAINPNGNIEKSMKQVMGNIQKIMKQTKPASATGNRQTGQQGDATRDLNQLYGR